MNTAKEKLAVARIHLLHMTIYSSSMLSMVLYGISKAIHDNDIFEGTASELLPHLEGENLDKFVFMSKELSLEHASKGGHAAGLIFMHAGIESCLVSVAKSIAEVSPLSFLPLLKDKQVSLEDAISLDQSDILGDRIKVFLLRMDRQSLVERTRTLFRLINDSNMPRGIFDEERVNRIEKLRNDCAHGRVDTANFSSIDDDLTYLREVGEFFIDLVAKKFKIPYTRGDLDDII